MQLMCEGHPQVRGLSPGLRQVLHSPTLLEEALIQGDSDADASGASIYGSVIRDGGRFRVWYQAWPRDWDGRDVVAVACAESDDGLEWRKPEYGLVECCGTRRNHLTDLPFHCPSVFVDPTAPSEARFRAFGYATPDRMDGRYPQKIERGGYFTAHSVDGLHWEIDSLEPVWPWSDVITSVWDPWSECARIALKRTGHAAGMYRRRFYTATWRKGEASEAVSALVPDEYDDLAARARGFHSADYYGVGLMPTPGPTIGFLWNFRHLPPLGYHEPQMFHYGRIGSVDLSIVYQLERGGRWLHVAGRPDWVRASDAPSWASGALYTAAYPLDVGDETWLYFTGTQEQHSWCGQGVDSGKFRRDLLGQGGFARIGLMKWPKNRILGYRAILSERLQIAPRTGAEDGKGMRLNLCTRPGGYLRVALLDGERKPVPGYTFEECDPIDGDHLEAPVTWQGRSSLPRLPDPASLIAEIELRDAVLYAFEFSIP